MAEGNRMKPINNKAVPSRIGKSQTSTLLAKRSKRGKREHLRNNKSNQKFQVFNIFKKISGF